MNNQPATLPPETATPQNLQMAVKNLEGMKQSMEAIYEASHFPENAAFADRLLNRALCIFEIGEAMNASSPV